MAVWRNTDSWSHAAVKETAAERLLKGGVPATTKPEEDHMMVRQVVQLFHSFLLSWCFGSGLPQ